MYLDLSSRHFKNCMLIHRYYMFSSKLSEGLNKIINRVFNFQYDIKVATIKPNSFL